MIRTPLQRLKEKTQGKNLWLYILYLAQDKEVKRKDVKRLIFEDFGFLVNPLLIRSVFYRLNSEGYVEKERFQSEKAYSTTEKGKEELKNGISYLKELMEKLEK